MDTVELITQYHDQAIKRVEELLKSYEKAGKVARTLGLQAVTLYLLGVISMMVFIIVGTPFGFIPAVIALAGFSWYNFKFNKALTARKVMFVEMQTIRQNLEQLAELIHEGVK